MTNKIRKQIFLIVFFNVLLLSVNNLHAQDSIPKKVNEDKVVYWFNLRINEVKDYNTGYMHFNIKHVDITEKKGTVDEFAYKLYKNLNEDIITIGPFEEKEQSLNSIKLYKSADWGNTDIDKLNLISIKNGNDSIYLQDVFWYIIHISQKKEENQWGIIRKPGGIASGTNEDYLLFLYDNLENRVLTIGPFLSMSEAEYSKRIYRLYKWEIFKLKLTKKLKL